MIKKARFSPCRRWRYTLHRIWQPGTPRLVQFLGLNPSTADEFTEDNTVRKCIRFAQMWGFGGMVMTNIFAWRDTDPRMMKEAIEPIGEENDYWIARTHKTCEKTIACWGNHGLYLDRASEMPKLIPNADCFKVTKQDQPWHPLYVPYKCKLQKYYIQGARHYG